MKRRYAVIALAAGGLLLISAGAFAACALNVGQVHEADVYGRYVARYRNGAETLTLNRDHTFQQEVRVDVSKTPVTASGTWSWRDSGGGYVDLHGCIAANDGRGSIRPDFAAHRDGCSYPPERKWFFFGQLRLGPDESAPLWKVQSF